MDADINKAFDNILCEEDKIRQRGFDEGYLKGKDSGLKEGYHSGFHRGAGVGKELGHYVGFAEALLLRQDQPPKLKATLTKLHKVSTEFPHDNQYNVDVEKSLETMRSLYKLSCSLAGLRPVFPRQLSKLSY